MHSDFVAPSVELFFGHVSMAEARIYARWTANSIGEGPITGTIRGPRCAYSKTLPATIPFREKGPGLTRLIEAIVPDPCLWTPELPFLYDVSIEWHNSQQQHQTTRQVVGMRAFGVRDGGFRWETRPWVLRAQRVASANPHDFPLWRDADVALAVPWPEDSLCQQAGEVGTMLVALCHDAASNPLAELQRLSRWPAVVLAVLPISTAWPADLTRLVPNLLLAETHQTSQPLSPWATLAVWDNPAPPPQEYAGKPVVWFPPCPLSEPFPNLAQLSAKQNEAKSTPAGYII